MIGTAFREISTEIRSDILSNKVIPALAVGSSSGLSLLVAQIAFGSLIFSGPLSTFSSQGIGLVLFGNFAVCLIVAIMGGFRGAIAGLSPTVALVMVQIGSTMGIEGEELFVTTVAALISGAVLTGACLLVIGQFGIANLVRFVPFSVAGGFVAGIGGVVCLKAMSFTGADVSWQALPGLLDADVFWRWSPGIAFGLTLYLAMRRWGQPLIMPVSVIVMIIAYHIALEAFGITGEEAREAGLLLTSTSDSGLWHPIGPADLAFVDPVALLSQVANILVLVLVVMIVLIMNLAGLELATNRDLDWNREFRATGIGCLVAGIGGGTTGSMFVPTSLRSHLFNATTRLTGICAALVIGAALFMGDGMLEIIPVPLVSGIVVFAGLGMLEQGLVSSRRRLPVMEYFFILLIAAVTMIFGLFEGMGTGMVITLVFFAVRLSRVDPVGRSYTGSDTRSTRSRSVPDRVILRESGMRICGWSLRGYVFFGSIYSLTDLLRKSLDADPRPICMILDFRNVAGFDVSAVNVLARFLRSAMACDVQVVLSAPTAQVRAGLERNLGKSEFSRIRFEHDEDRAIEFCENILIENWKEIASRSEEHRANILHLATAGLEYQLDRQIEFEQLIEDLQHCLQENRFEPGDSISGPGMPITGMQLLTSGRASTHDPSGRRIRQYNPGDAIWSVDPSDKDAPVITADDSCVTMTLAPTARLRLESRDTTLTLRLYRYLLSGHFSAEVTTPAREQAPEPSVNA